MRKAILAVFILLSALSIDGVAQRAAAITISAPAIASGWTNNRRQPATAAAAYLGAAAILAMGQPADLGRPVGRAAAEFLGERRAASGAGRHLGVQMASAFGPAVGPTRLALASSALPGLAIRRRDLMNKRILASAALASALSVAAPGGASAMNVTRH